MIFFMLRSVRLDAAGAVHHVIIRGIERRKIFKDSQSGMVYAINKGERITKERDYQLLK